MPKPPALLPKFERLFEHAHDGVVLLSANSGRILDINPRACEMMGRNRASIVGQRLGAFIHDPKSLARFTKAVTNHGVGWTDTVTWPGKTGKPLPVDISASGFESRSGRYVLLVLHETSKAHRRETRRAAMTSRRKGAELREQLDLFQQDVLNIASHEFRTPLTPILLQLHLLQTHLKPFLNAADMDAFQMIRRNMDRVEASAKEILLAVEERARTISGQKPATHPHH